MRNTRRPRPAPARPTARAFARALGLALAAWAGAPAAAGGQGAPPPIRPTRPTIANDAEVHQPGVLQAEVGSGVYGRTGERRDQGSASLLVRYAFSERFLAHAAFDAVVSARDLSGRRSTGPGDVWLFGQGVLVTGAERRPAVAVAYDVKLPAASARDGLGTGRVDHRVVLLVSRALGGTELAFNAAYVDDGRDAGAGRVGGGQWALAASREPERRGWGTQWEVSTQTVDAADPRGTYALGAATYHAGPRVRLDLGARAGLTRASAHGQLFLGVTAGAPIARRAH
jgi:hypothetical protein